VGAPEPSVLQGDGTVALGGGGASAAEAMRRSTREPARQEVVVAGFWRRALAAGIDVAVITPAALLLSWIAGKLAGVSLPVTENAPIDFWLDQALAGDPALWGAFGLCVAIAVIYLFLFQLTLARTLGMRALKLEIIDVYGEAPVPWRAAARTAGYLACLLTLGLGFVWVGFDREKRGLHDWLAGTYVIRGRVGARGGKA
jgi:uncharacterized RDD family membrane protein YckC